MKKLILGLIALFFTSVICFGDACDKVEPITSACDPIATACDPVVAACAPVNTIPVYTAVPVRTKTITRQKSICVNCEQIAVPVKVKVRKAPIRTKHVTRDKAIMQNGCSAF